jgi:hypothetical protein
MSEALGDSVGDTNVTVNGRGAAQPLAPERHADLIRGIVQRTAAGAPPSVRRRAIVLASMRVAQTAANERGKA